MGTITGSTKSSAYGLRAFVYAQAENGHELTIELDGWTQGSGADDVNGDYIFLGGDTLWAVMDPYEYPYDWVEADFSDMGERVRALYGSGIVEINGIEFYDDWWDYQEEETGPNAHLWVGGLELNGGDEKIAYQLVPGEAIGGVLGSDSTAGGGTKKYYHDNDLGTVQVETDEDGAKSGCGSRISSAITATRRAGVRAGRIWA